MGRVLGQARRARRRIATDAGMTVIEAVVAAFLLIGGALAVMAVIGAGTRNTFRAEQSQVAVNRLQEELEMIKQLPFDEIAMPAVPPDSGDPDDPNARISGTQYDVDPGNGSTLAAVAYDGSTLVGGGTVSGGQVMAGPTEFESGDVTGDLYRYVVWLDDPSCAEAQCPGAQDLKRVIVAIKLDATASGGARAYQELHTDIADPEAQPEVNPGAGGGGDGEDDDGDGDPNDDDEPQPFPWNFWLTDTTCNNSTRQPITADHNTHNTRGICSDGQQTGGTTGAPDLMFPEAPPLNEDLPPDEQPLYDYATDVEPSSGGGLDKGVQLRRPGSNIGSGCLVNDLLGGTQISSLENTPGQKIHKWLTPPIPSGFNDILLTGNGTLHLWTQTLNGAEHAGNICIYLFRRQLDVLGQYVDTPVVNLTPPLLGLTYFEYSQSPWPRNSWQKLEIPLNFAADIDGGAVPLAPDTRLGVAIRVERSGTGGDALQFMYDHPSFDSRLVVNANQEIPLTF